MPDDSTPKLGLGLEAFVWVPNLLLLLVVVLIGLIGRGAPEAVSPLVATDRSVSALIQKLEQKLARDPTNGAVAIELAGLYQKAGELPFSYQALLSAEQKGKDEPNFRMKLGLAYLEIGRNGDGRRILRTAFEQCTRNRGAARACPPATRARLSIFLQVADLMVESNINARKQPSEVVKVFAKVLKKVTLPANLGSRSSGGALGPASRPAPQKAGGSLSQKSSRAATQPAQP